MGVSFSPQGRTRGFREVALAESMPPPVLPRADSARDIAAVPGTILATCRTLAVHQCLDERDLPRAPSPRRRTGTTAANETRARPKPPDPSGGPEGESRGLCRVAQATAAGRVLSRAAALSADLDGFAQTPQREELGPRMPRAGGWRRRRAGARVSRLRADTLSLSGRRGRLLARTTVDVGGTQRACLGFAQGIHVWRSRVRAAHFHTSRNERVHAPHGFLGRLTRVVDSMQGRRVTRGPVAGGGR